MPLRNVRYRFKQTSPTTRVRLAYRGPKVVEVTAYRKRNGKFVKGHSRKVNGK